MRIKVKSLPGDEYCVDVQTNQRVLELKAIINQKSDGQVPIDRQKLVFKGRTLQDNDLISDYNLEEDCRIHLIKQKSDISYPQTPSMHTIHNTIGSGSSRDSLSTTSSSSFSPSGTQDSGRVGDIERDTSSVEMQSKQTLRGLPAHDRFSRLLSERLMKHFQPSVHQRIMSRLEDEILADINSSSLDDLERLAKQKLNISEE